MSPMCQELGEKLGKPGKAGMIHALPAFTPNFLGGKAGKSLESWEIPGFQLVTLGHDFPRMHGKPGSVHPSFLGKHGFGNVLHNHCFPRKLGNSWFSQKTRTYFLQESLVS